MTTLVVRHLADGEEDLFDSMPDPIPTLIQTAYAAGVAGGGFRPGNTWVALRDGRVVGRAAWLQPPGAVGQPWLERFDLIAEPEIGAALLHAAHEALGGPKPYYATAPADWRIRPQVLAAIEAPKAAARLAGLVERTEKLRFAWRTGTSTPLPSRLPFRTAETAAEIEAVVARIATPAVLTGSEAAQLILGVDLAREPLRWLTGPLSDWRIALESGRTVGIMAATGDACYPMIAYLGLLEESALGDLLADAVARLAAKGALEIVADVDAGRRAAGGDRPA